MKYIKRTLIGLSILIILGATVFLVYVSDYEKANANALEALNSTELVNVTVDETLISFEPTTFTEVGLIFYPGGKVEPTVYSRVFHQLASNGIAVYVVKMPFNLAMFNINGADHVLNRKTNISEWYLGGHSLGGVFATEHLKNNFDKYQGMVYFASYPNSDISDAKIRVLSITASLDTVINKDSLEKARVKLPSNTVHYVIEGGNHTQFGDYDLQKKDSEAKISYEKQHQEIVKEVLIFMRVGN